MWEYKQLAHQEGGKRKKMQRRNLEKLAAFHRKSICICILAIALVYGTFTATPCHGAEGEQGMVEGEGMIHPPSEESMESVFGEAAANENTTDEKLEQLIPQIQNSLPVNNGSWSVYVGDLVNETEAAVNEQVMQAASLIKLYIMGAVYEQYDSLCQQYGQETVDANLYSMITVSDNDAANTLVLYLGGGDSTAGMQTVNDFCTDEGYTSTHMGRLLLQSNAYDDNYTSVSDCGHFLNKVYWEDYTYAESMLTLLSAQQRRHKIPAQISDTVSVANKTGELSDVENDAGIIYNAQNDLVLVFMSQNLTEVGSAQSTIATISRQIYDYYNG